MKRVEIEPVKDFQKAADIVRTTIRGIYPHYYPEGAVRFFEEFHSLENIRKASRTEEIFFLNADESSVGTGSIRGNEICRLFILPEYEGKGYGSRLMERLEELIFERFETVRVDASFPAEPMYLKRGYRICSFQKIETEGGDFLCYHTMEKKKTAGKVGGAECYD